MTLRKKTLVITGALLAALIVVLYAISETTLSRSFIKLEEQDTRRNVERATDALSDRLSALDTICDDWASWDDTYAFIEDANAEYIESNLVDGTFAGLRLNFMLFINSSGEIVFGKAFDLQNNEETPIPKSLQEQIFVDDLLVHHPDTDSSITGIVLLPESPVLIASEPILTSADEGPIRGALIIGRYLDFAEIEYLAGITHLSLTMCQFDDPQVPADFQEARSSLSEEAPILIRPLSPESVAGYVLVNDVYARPALVLRVDMPRDIYQQGQAVERYLMMLLLVAGVAFSVVTLLVLDKRILARLAQVSSSVRNISATRNLSTRVSVTGSDELSHLATAINRTLDSLEASQHELRQSEEKYRALFDSAVGGTFVIDAETMKVVLGNQAAAKIYGFNSVEEALGVNPLDFIPLNDRERVLNVIVKDMFEQDLRQTNEFQTTTKDGREIWISAVGTRIEHQGKLAGLVSFTDITERKQAEEELRESEERYSRLYENLSEAVALFRLPDLKISHWNKRYEDLHKLISAQGIENITISDIASVVEADDWDRAMEVMAKTLAGEPAPEIYEIKMKDLEGKMRVFEVRPALYKEKDQAVGIQVAMADITERKQAEEALRESQERYIRLYESINEAVALYRLPDLKISHWNKQYEDLHKLLNTKDIEDITISDMASVVEADDLDRATEALAKTLAGEPLPEIYEIRMKDLEGKRRVFEVKPALYREKDQVVGIQVAMADITERKQAEEQLKSSFIDLAETASRAMGSRDPYTASHQQRVAKLARLVGEKMGLDKDRLEGLYIGGLLHDIGKISTPESILSKPGELSEEEWALIRAHTKQGYKILKDTDFPWPVVDMAVHHHERLDGSGYPHGIGGDKLSLEVRILAVCDVVEAMSSHRPYRPARNKEEVVEEIRGGRATKYDPNVVDIMLQIIETGGFGFGWEAEARSAHL